MIKRIQLRGISRTPSDRMAADGGCAESLNVHLEESELAPTQAPSDVTSSYYPTGSGTTPDNAIYIHKGTNYENMICLFDKAVKYYTGSAWSTIITIGNTETLSDIKSVGNTLIVASSAKMYYALWTGSSYKNLGNRIPIPQVHFRIGNMDAARATPNVPYSSSTPPSITDGYDYSYFEVQVDTDMPSIPHSSVGQTHEYGSLSNRYLFEGSKDGGVWVDYLSHVWDNVLVHLSEQVESGKVVFPMFIRYAVRLYDGSVYSQSIPVLLGADISKFVDIKTTIDQWYTNNADDIPMALEAVTWYDYASGYSVYMNIGSQGSIFNDWKDIVSGVDIFVSPQMIPFQRNAAKFRSTFYSEYEDHDRNNWMRRNFKLDNFVLDPYYMEDNQEELVKSYQTTYRAKSFTVDQFSALSGDVQLSDINFSSDWLMSQEALKETPGSMHHTVAKDLFAYNKRLILGRASQILFNGYAHLPSVLWSTSNAAPTSYLFVYYFRGENGECIIRSRDVSNNEYISQHSSSSLVNGSSTTRYEKLASWIAYPDARCYLVEVYYNSGNNTYKASFQMNPSLQLDVSYAFLGFGTQPTFTLFTGTIPTEKLNYSYEDSLLVSQFGNPFMFGTGDAINFGGRVVNVAVITHPLSQGQVGQFSLYVFTTDGIYALSVKEDGSFSNIATVSRDVLLSKNALIAVEQGVYFVTKKGVMHLIGMTITDISRVMIGRQPSVSTSVLNSIWADHRNYISDTTPFMTFMENCSIAYDHTGRRLIFFYNTKPYQYVYMLETKTWHTIGTQTASWKVLNSYPECLVSLNGGILKFSSAINSTAYFSDDTNVKNCVIITRPFDLEEPDIRKAIKSIRIRGRYNRNDVKYILLGSFDGINWKRLDTLRGGSYKMFQLVIRATLAPAERISWIDVDYETRFTNRLR